MRSLDLQRQQLQRLALRPLAIPGGQRVWESEVQATGHENEILRLPLAAANILLQGTMVWGISDWFGSDVF